MVSKRHFDNDEEINMSAYKYPRHMEHNQVSSFMEFHHCDSYLKETYSSGEVTFGKRHVIDIISQLPLGNTKSEIGAPGTVSSSWVTNGYNEKPPKAEEVFPSSPYTESFEPNDTRSVQTNEPCFSYFDHSPRKLVSIGPNHQADIPVWDLKGMTKASTYSEASDTHKPFSQCSGSRLSFDEENEDKRMGTCLIPMPKDDRLAYANGSVGHGLTDCCCSDRRSVRCVKMHIMESRDRLRASVGSETFVELGFYEMGEVVARKWSEHEEQVFHEVVYSNSMSSGKNFWDHLSVTFPYRTQKDLVSYYFNVFMLRKRADQNRTDSLDIDSDNDEWQGSDEEEDESVTAEEDEDIVDTSRGNHYYRDEHEDHFYAEDEEGDESSGGADKLIGGCSFSPEVRLLCKKSESGEEGNDVQDDSCMSYEIQANKAGFNSQVEMGTTMLENQVEKENSGYLQHSYDKGLKNSTVEHGYILGPYDVNGWDDGYFSRVNEDINILPTFDMIEEVFGEEAWNDNATDGKSH